jgi:AraC-like DNA-binding protein
MGVGVLCFESVFRGDGIEIADVACAHRAGRGAPESADVRALVFVRRGSFIRHADGHHALLDPTCAYAINVGQEHRYDHHNDLGDDCTALYLSAEVVSELWGGSPELPSGPLPAPPDVDLAHRVLLATAKRREDEHEVGERALALAARALAQLDERRVVSGRPATTAARRALVDGVREALADDRERSLPELARELSFSPHHVSRVFRAMTGHTISRHRMRLRTRDALERLAGGERNLALVAAAAGFADESHLSRVMRRETGETPAALRDALGQP